MNLQQQSDECGYALEAFAKVLKNNNIELIMEYQKEYRKIEIRNQRIQNEMNYNFVQSEKTEAYKEWENSWINWSKKKNEH